MHSHTEFDKFVRDLFFSGFNAALLAIGVILDICYMIKRDWVIEATLTGLVVIYVFLTYTTAKDARKSYKIYKKILSDS